MKLLALDEQTMTATETTGAEYWRRLAFECADDAMPPPFVLQHCRDQMRAKPEFVWWFWPRLFVLSQPKQIVGSALFKSFDHVTGATEIGYGVADGSCCRGYATAGIGLMVAETFSHPETQLVFGLVTPANKASIRVLLRNGFVQTGEAEDPDDGHVLRFDLPRSRFGLAFHPVSA
jgi:RimJ/RimL family protein N-acetyltransferase